MKTKPIHIFKLAEELKVPSSRILDVVNRLDVVGVSSEKSMVDGEVADLVRSTVTHALALEEHVRAEQTRLAASAKVTIAPPKALEVETRPRVFGAKRLVPSPTVQPSPVVSPAMPPPASLPAAIPTPEKPATPAHRSPSTVAAAVAKPAVAEAPRRVFPAKRPTPTQPPQGAGIVSTTAGAPSAPPAARPTPEKPATPALGNPYTPELRTSVRTARLADLKLLVDGTLPALDWEYFVVAHDHVTRGHWADVNVAYRRALETVCWHVCARLAKRQPPEEMGFRDLIKQYLIPTKLFKRKEISLMESTHFFLSEGAHRMIDEAPARLADDIVPSLCRLIVDRLRSRIATSP